MEKLLEKARRLSVSERKKLAEQGIYLTNIDPSKEEEVTMIVLSLIYSDEELDTLESYDKEVELFVKIISKTYGVEEKDLKN